MTRQKLSNISLADFRRYLFDMGCKRAEQGTKGRGGHEKWVKPGLLRPITIQTHVDSVYHGDRPLDRQAIIIEKYLHN